MSKPILTDQDFQSAAKRLKCDIAAIKTVAEVESKGAAFYSDGFPTILFERHKFHEFTKGKYDKTHPEISNAESGGYGKAGANQRRKFNIAFDLDPIAAMKSCSWGKFQIMGFNYAVCGFKSVGEFVDAMKESEGAQLLAFVNFVIGNGLADELRNHKWAAFARGYNGEGYKKNNYDKKLAAAYKKYSKLPAVAAVTQTESDTPPADVLPVSLPETAGDDSALATATEETTAATMQTAQGEIKQEITTKNEQDVTEEAEVKEPEKQGFLKKLGAGIASLLGGTLLYDSVGKFAGIQLTREAVFVLCFIILLAFIGFCVWAVLDVWKKNKKTEIEALANSDVTRKNIRWVKPE